MADSKRTTPRSARNSSKHNTIILLPDGTTKSLWINPTLLDDLVYCHEETRVPLSRIVNNALDLYNETEGACMIHRAQQKRARAV